MKKNLMRQVIHELKEQGMSMEMAALSLADAETDQQYIEIMKYLKSIRSMKVTTIEAAETIQKIIENN